MSLIEGENMYFNILKKKKGFTLIEVVIASAVFVITFGGMLVGQKMARHHAENSLISFVVLHHSQGLIEAIQSYRYQDPTYSNAGSAFNEHPNNTNSASYVSDKSGVYDDTLTTREIALPEESLGLRYHPTTKGSTALVPFVRDSALQYNDRLIGCENKDASSGSIVLSGIYKIRKTDRLLNSFAKDGIGQEKYFFADDVDDFDGYRETNQEILPGVLVTFDVSVSGVYDNVTNYTHIAPALTITQAPYSIMQEEMSVKHFRDDLGLKNDPDSKTVAFDYYSKMLFKKITVLATWEYPTGSGKQHSLVIDGGKMKPEGNAQ